MSENFTPIETKYKGYRFRSRLEARWAVFFDHVNIKYEYEPEGFEHNGIKYLPDFYLPEFDVYAEVKADREGIEKDFNKCAGMIYWGGPIKAIVFLGNIPGDVNESKGGMWHFPTLYYSYPTSSGLAAAWWFFCDCGETATGQISHADYPQPFCEIDGKLYGRFLKFEKGIRYYSEFSLSPVSDEDLRKTNKRSETYPSLEDNMTAQYSTNPKTFDAFAAARQARFEHGEQP